MRLLRTNSSKTLDGSLVKSKQRLRTRGNPKTIIERSFSGANFAARPSALAQKKKANERILHFVTRYHQVVNNLKQKLMGQCKMMESNTKSASAENCLREICSSVIGMTQSLGWDSLEKRRNGDSVIMMYKLLAP